MPLQSTARGRSTHRPALDGIRALAVIPVLLYHGNVGWATGGFLGVDVFFVLSGYLITSLLVREYDRWGHLDFGRFYIRRARRLLPALVLVVAAVAIWAATSSATDKLGQIRGDGIASLLYVANWRFVLVHQSYFDQFGDPSPFRHMWSLAIEEQYYLFFPILLLALLRVLRGNHLRVAAALSALAACSALLMAQLYEPGVDPSRVYFGTDTRIQELFIGSALALLAGEWHRVKAGVTPILSIAGVIAFGTIGWSYVTSSDTGSYLYRGGFALLCVVVAVLIASVELEPAGAMGRALSWRPLVWIGMISYGLYLWHWPVYIAASPTRTGLDGPVLLLVRLAATVVIASVSFYLVERPIRQGELLRRLRAPFGLLTAVGAMPLALVVLLIGTSAATPPQLPDSPFATTQPRGSGPASMLVVGDSVGLSLARGFQPDDYPGWSMTASTKLGCGILSGQLAYNGEKGLIDDACDSTFSDWESAVQHTSPKAVLMVLGTWEVMDHVRGGEIVQTGTPAFASYLLKRLEAARTILTAGGAHLFLTNVPCYAAESTGLNVDPAPMRNDPARQQAVNEVFTEFAASHPDDTTLLDLRGQLCPDGTYVTRQDGAVVRYDGVHFSTPGARAQWRWIMPLIGAASDSSGLRLLTVGDSVPYGLASHWHQADHPDMALQDSTQLGCGLLPYPISVNGETQSLPSNCAPWSASLDGVVAKSAANVGLIFLGEGQQFDVVVDGNTLPFGSDEYRTWLASRLHRLITLFRARSVPVGLVNVPCHNVVDPGTSAVPATINDDQRIRQLNDILDDIARSENVRVLDLYDYLCADGYVDEVDGQPLRDDGLHFTDFGASYVWEFLAPQVKQLLKGAGQDTSGN